VGSSARLLRRGRGASPGGFAVRGYTTAGDTSDSRNDIRELNSNRIKFSRAMAACVSFGLQYWL